MGQHRTRKQKEHAQITRQLALTPLYSLNTLKTNQTFSTENTKSPEKNLKEHLYIFQDLKKTFYVSIIIIALLGIIWGRIH